MVDMTCYKPATQQLCQRLHCEEEQSSMSCCQVGGGRGRWARWEMRYCHSLHWCDLSLLEGTRRENWWGWWRREGGRWHCSVGGWGWWILSLIARETPPGLVGYKWNPRWDLLTLCIRIEEKICPFQNPWKLIIKINLYFYFKTDRSFRDFFPVLLVLSICSF